MLTSRAAGSKWKGKQWISYASRISRTIRPRISKRCRVGYSGWHRDYTEDQSVRQLGKRLLESFARSVRPEKDGRERDWTFHTKAGTD